MPRIVTPEVRFHEKVERSPGGCWLWMGSKDSDGYGRFWFVNRTIHAQRGAWLLFKGEIPDGLYVLHECDTPACVNPNHLFLGTALDNAQDAKRKGRVVSGDRHRAIHASGLPRGDEHWTRRDPVARLKNVAKLTPDDIREIRKRRVDGESLRKLGRAFGVSSPTILRAVNGTGWKWLQ